VNVKMSEKEKMLISCQICKDVCKRGVSVKCCGTRACRACATKQVTSNRFCWNNACRVPMKTDDLVNDESLRTAVNNVKAGLPIPEEILKQLQVTESNENTQNQAQKRSADASNMESPTKCVKTEEEEYEIVKKWDNGRIVEVKQLKKNGQVIEIMEIKEEKQPTLPVNQQVTWKGGSYSNGNTDKYDVTLKDNLIESRYFTVMNPKVTDGLTKIFVSLSCARKTDTSFGMLELAALNHGNGQMFHSTSQKTQKRENRIQEFGDFLGNSKGQNESLVLIFYSRFEMCAFLKFGGHGMGLSRAMYLKNLQACGVRYISFLNVSSFPIKPLNDVVDCKSYDIKSLPSLVAKLCQENADVKLHRYEMSDFTLAKDKPYKLAAEIIYDKSEYTAGGKEQVYSALHFDCDGIISVIQDAQKKGKDWKPVLELTNHNKAAYKQFSRFQFITSK